MKEHNLEEKHTESKLTVACELVEHRLTILWSAIDAIDTKTNITLGFASTILVLLAGFYSLGSRAWPLLSLVMLGLALVAYIVLAFLSVLAYRIKAWSYRPDVNTLLKHCENEKYSIAEIKRWVATECNSSYYDNLDKVKKKATLVNSVLVLFLVETVLLALGLAYALFVS